MERDNLAFTEERNASVVHTAQHQAVVLSLAQHRCHIEHLKWNRHRWQIQRQHQICDNSKLHCCFRGLLFFRSGYQFFFFFHLTMLAFCCNTFLMALALFFFSHEFFCTHVYCTYTNCKQTFRATNRDAGAKQTSLYSY